MHNDNEQFRALMLNNIIDSPDVAGDLLPYIKGEYFKVEYERQLWNIISKFNEEFKKAPSRAIINVGLEKNTKLNPQEKRQAKAMLEKQTEEVDREWLVQTSEEWCRLRASVNAVTLSMQIMDGLNTEHTMDEMPEILSDAVSVSFDKRIGLDYFEDVEERFDMYNHKETCIPTGVEHFDDLFKGGYPQKSLTCFMAGTGTGKSLTLCHSAASAIKNGHNALYISMEMSEYKITERIDFNLLEMGGVSIMNMEKEEYVSRFQKMQQKNYGRFFCKEYGTGSASIIQFRKLVQDLKQKKNFTPDIIFVDYINICASARAGKNANSYERVKHIAEELRSFAFECNVPLVTATQTGRNAQGTSDVSLEDTSESIGLPQTCDIMIGLSSTEEMRDSGLMKSTTLKNRFGDLNYHKYHMLGVEYAKMTLFNLDEQPAHIEATQVGAKKEETGGYSKQQNDLFGESKPKKDEPAINW